MSKVILVCAAVTLGSLAVLLLIYFGFDASSQGNLAREKMHIEIAKLFAQLTLLGVLGVIVKAVIDNYSVERAKLDARAEMRRGIWRDLRSVYAQVEIARNLIEGAKSAKTYGEQLRKVMELHSRLGEIRHEITIPSDLFKTKSDIGERIKAMEKYLVTLIDEYTSHNKALGEKQIEYEKERQSGSTRIDMDAELNKLPVLKDFRKASAEGAFQDFRKKYSEARRAVISELVENA